MHCIYDRHRVTMIKYTFIDEDSIEFNRYPKSFLMFLCSESNSFKSTCFFLCQQKSIPIITLFLMPCCKIIQFSLREIIVFTHVLNKNVARLRKIAFSKK